MPIFTQFKHRSEEEEIIDDFSMAGEDVIKTFKTIERVNTLLGGNQVLVSGVRHLVSQISDGAKPLHLYDLGCGSGDGLRAIARWARKKSIPLQLTGIDANEFIVQYAREKAAKYPEIRFVQQDIFDSKCSLEKADLVTFNLCLHHFTEEEQAVLISKCLSDGVKGILINDLHRHWLAYYAFWGFSLLTRAHKIAREDGLLSIKKGFKKNELYMLGAKAGFRQASIRWRWAFRYEMSLFQ
jgi:2-polyprenyl-3-methyl-5-hydroxy-6-metoxy-1,4-benzoquinol methylase